MDSGYYAGLADKAKTAAFGAAGVTAARDKVALSKIQGKACSGHGDCEGGVCFNGACQPKPENALCVESDVGLESQRDKSECESCNPEEWKNTI